MRHLRWYIKYPLAFVECLLLIAFGSLNDFEFSALPIILAGLTLTMVLGMILQRYW